MSSNLLNYALYQVGWLAAVLGAAEGHPWVGGGLALAALAAHLALVQNRRAECLLVLAAGATGLLADSLQVTLGRLSFTSGTVVPWLCPPWIVVMWMQFATTFRFSLRWLIDRPARAAAAGAIGGPLAYVVGERLGAVTLRPPRDLTIVVLSAIWVVCLAGLASVGRPGESGEYRLRRRRGTAGSDV